MKGGFGHLRLGRATTPVFFATLAYNPLGDSFGFSPIVRALWGGTGKVAGDTGWNNAITYSTPNFGGVSGNLQYSFKEGAGNNSRGGVAGNLMYNSGPLGLVLAASQTKVPFATEKETTMLFGASYDLKFVKLWGHYGQVKEGLTGTPTQDTKDKIMHFSVSAPIGRTTLIAGWAQAKTSGALNGKRQFATLGARYALSKRTETYAMFHRDKLENVGTGNTFAVGLKHVF